MLNFYGWRLLAVFWLIMMIASALPLYAGSVLNGYMLKELNASRDWYSIPMSLLQFVFGIGALGVATVIEKYGVKGTLILGGIAGAVGGLLLALVVNSALQATLVFGFVVGAGFCLAGGITTQVGVTRWFLRRRALAIAILMSAPGIGGFFTAPLMNHLVSSFGGEWRIGWGLVCVLFLLASLMAFLFVKEDPSDLRLEPDGLIENETEIDSSSKEQPDVAPFVTEYRWRFQEVIRDKVFWGLLICGIGVNVGMTLYFAIGIVHLQDLGKSASVGSWALGVYGISALLSKFILGGFGDRVDPRYIWSGMIFVFGLGAFLLARAEVPIALNMFPVLMGVGYGGHIACMLAVISNYYGKQVFPAVAGTAVALTTCSGALAPFIAKGFYDDFGSYAPAFIAMSLWSILGGLVMITLKRPSIT